jgi:hypothetical protein
VWWLTSVTLALGGLKQKNQEFKASLGYNNKFKIYSGYLVVLEFELRAYILSHSSALFF